MIAFRAVEDIQPNTVLEWDYTCIHRAAPAEVCESPPSLCGKRKRAATRAASSAPLTSNEYLYDR